jgi:uncharacterized protein involved in response to NO
MDEDHGGRERPAGHGSKTSPRRLVAGNTVFFPAAAAFAIFVLPASLLAMNGNTGAFPALASPTGHAHEMLFGFALAVVAGNQLGAVTMPRLALLAGLWAIARLTYLSDPQSMAAAATNTAFAALLAAHIAPRLLRAAKKVRNQALPLVLIGICASGIAFHLAPRVGFASAEHTILGVAVLLFAVLMIFMGGRLMAAAVAGQFYRQGAKLDARVQPRIESGLLAAMLAAIATAMLGERPLFVMLTAAATAVAGVLAAVRLLRWRLWALRGRPDLFCIAAGYAWLALGLLLFSAALVAGRYQTAALHIITVGGLGTLTLNVMAMTWAHKAGQDPARARAPVWATIMLGTAALARALASLDAGSPLPLLWLAALCWSGAFALLLIRSLRIRARGN